MVYSLQELILAAENKFLLKYLAHSLYLRVKNSHAQHTFKNARFISAQRNLYHTEIIGNISPIYKIWCHS